MDKDKRTAPTPWCMSDEDFASWCRARRKALGLSQTRFWNDIGVSLQAGGAIERGGNANTRIKLLIEVFYRGHDLPDRLLKRRDRYLLGR